MDLVKDIDQRRGVTGYLDKGSSRLMAEMKKGGRRDGASPYHHIQAILVYPHAASHVMVCGFSPGAEAQLFPSSPHHIPHPVQGLQGHLCSSQPGSAWRALTALCMSFKGLLPSSCSLGSSFCHKCNCCAAGSVHCLVPWLPSLGSQLRRGLGLSWGLLGRIQAGNDLGSIW